MKRSIWAGIAMVGVLFTGACQDLVITNPNQPDRNRAITQPADVEALVIGSWGLFMSRTHRSGSCYNTMPTVADEGTATYANSASLELSSEPRILLNNSPSSMAQDVPRYQWYDWYEMLSNCNDALIAINGGLDIVDDDGDRTQQTLALAKFQQGLALGYLGMLFDRAIIATEDTDISNPSTLDPVPYGQVLEAAYASLAEAISLSAGQSWCIDNMWEDRVTCASDIGPVAHAYIARFMVLGARSRAEREALNWSTVVSHLDQGVDALGEPFYINLSRTGQRSSYRYRIQTNGSFSQRADYYTIGMADVTGAWQAWMADPINDRVKFEMDSPDRRVIGPDGPQDDGTYFEYRSNENFRPERGLYHFSYYQFDRYGGAYREGQLDLIPLDEARLFRAEAAMRMGNNALAAELINVTRVGNGMLPPVTASGVTQAADCVPKTPSGACGSLELALYYERQIEGVGIDCQRAFQDRRGFDMLTPNTFIHFAIPGDELANLGWDIYTFGGGGEGSAPGWALW